MSAHIPYLRGEFMKKIALILLFPCFVFASKYTTVQILSAQSMGASFNSPGLDLNQLNLHSIQAVWSGTAENGTLKIQVSNDNVADPSKVVNWTDYTGSSLAISADGNQLYNMSFAGYHWVRLVYTRSSGTGSMSATFSGKGIN